jgi:hypothetical protein
MYGEHGLILPWGCRECEWARVGICGELVSGFPEVRFEIMRIIFLLEQLWILGASEVKKVIGYDFHISLQ